MFPVSVQRYEYSFKKAGPPEAILLELFRVDSKLAAAIIC